MPEEVSGLPAEVGNLEAGAEGSALVRLAIDRGVDVEILERLVSLQEHIYQRDARREFFEALARVQEAAPDIPKTREADIATRGGGGYAYKFAPLEDVVPALRPILREHGFSFGWTTEGLEGGVLRVVCILRHIAGHEERATFPVPTETKAAMSGAQKLGSALTYGRRQSFISVLGLVTVDEDTDARLGVDRESKISEEQLADLSALIEEVGANAERFKAYLGVKDLADLPVADLPGAISSLEMKREQQKGGKGENS